MIVMKTTATWKAAAQKLAAYRHENAGRSSGPSRPGLSEYIRWLILRDMDAYEKEISAKRG